MSTTPSTKLISIDHFGYHRGTGGVIWLEQGFSGENALNITESSPFHVKPRKAVLNCNHRVPLSQPLPPVDHWQVYQQIMDDPIVRACEPVPKVTPVPLFLVDNYGQSTLHLLTLSRMTSPVNPAVLNIRQTRERIIIDQLSVTNAQPLIITGLGAEHTETIIDLGEVAITSPRHLILTGKDDVILPPTVQAVETGILNHPIEDIMTLTWEAIGATIARRYMRGEPREFDMDKWLKQRRERRAKRKA